MKNGIWKNSVDMNHKKNGTKMKHSIDIGNKDELDCE